MHYWNYIYHSTFNQKKIFFEDFTYHLYIISSQSLCLLYLNFFINVWKGIKTSQISVFL